MVSDRGVNPKWARWWSTAAIAAAVAASTIFCRGRESLVEGAAQSARGVAMRGCGRRERLRYRTIRGGDEGASLSSSVA